MTRFGFPRAPSRSTVGSGVVVMANLVRWAVSVVALAHGLVHLIPAAERLGWIDDPALETSTPNGVLWLTAGVLLLTTSVLAAVDVSWYCLLAIVAALVSQAAILTAWDSAATGTLANLLLLALAILAVLMVGPGSYHAQWRSWARRVQRTTPPATRPLAEEDLGALPALVADHVRRSGALGSPPPHLLRADFHGRVRAAPGEPWQPFTGTQISTFGPDPQRYFLMDARRGGLPITVLHCYARGQATMRGRVLSLFSVMNASGPEMDRGETVTIFNDMVVLAPGALVSAPIDWTELDEHRVRGDYRNGDVTVSAELVFDDTGRLVDFVSDDRPRAADDGSWLTTQQWSTPSPIMRERAGYRFMSGTARWYEPDGWFTYVEMEFDEIVLDSRQGGTGVSPTRART